MQHEGLIGEEEDFREVYQLFFAEKPWPPEISGKCVSHAILTLQVQKLVRL